MGDLRIDVGGSSGSGAVGGHVRPVVQRANACHFWSQTDCPSVNLREISQSSRSLLGRLWGVMGVMGGWQVKLGIKKHAYLYLL